MIHMPDLHPTDATGVHSGEKMKRTYINLNVHVKPDGEAGLEQMVGQLDKYGYRGCVILNHSDKWFPCPNIKLTPGFKLFWGVEIRASSPHELGRLINKFRPDTDLLAVHGGNEMIDRAAASDSRVDLLAHPGRMNHIMMRFASGKGIAIEFNLSDLIHLRGKSRARALFIMQENLKLAKKYGTQVVLSAGARTINDIRAPREIIALAKLSGMDVTMAKDALSAVIIKKRS